MSGLRGVCRGEMKAERRRIRQNKSPGPPVFSRWLIGVSARRTGPGKGLRKRRAARKASIISARRFVRRELRAAAPFAGLGRARGRKNDRCAGLFPARSRFFAPRDIPDLVHPVLRGPRGPRPTISPSPLLEAGVVVSSTSRSSSPREERDDPGVRAAVPEIGDGAPGAGPADLCLEQHFEGLGAGAGRERRRCDHSQRPSRWSGPTVANGGVIRFSSPSSPRRPPEVPAPTDLRHHPVEAHGDFFPHQRGEDVSSSSAVWVSATSAVGMVPRRHPQHRGQRPVAPRWKPQAGSSARVFELAAVLVDQDHLVAPCRSAPAPWRSRNRDAPMMTIRMSFILTRMVRNGRGDHVPGDSTTSSREKTRDGPAASPRSTPPSARARDRGPSAPRSAPPRWTAPRRFVRRAQAARPSPRRDKYAPRPRRAARNRGPRPPTHAHLAGPARP